MTFALFCMIIGIVFYGYIIASVAAGLANADAQRARYQERLDAIKSFLQVANTRPINWTSLNRKSDIIAIFSNLLLLLGVRQGVKEQNTISCAAGLAQSVERLTAEREVVGSILGTESNTQGLKMTEKWRYCFCPANGSTFAWLEWSRKMAVSSPVGDVKIVSPSAFVLNTLTRK